MVAAATNLQEGPFTMGAHPHPDQSQVFPSRLQNPDSGSVLTDPGPIIGHNFTMMHEDAAEWTIDLEVKWDDVSLDQISNIKPSTDGIPTNRQRRFCSGI